ncbi:MAG TPA: membrane protein insertase YidC, partial [Cellvibrionaceae bacterium]
MAITKMDWQKNLLLAAMAAVVIMLIFRYNDFQQTYQPPTAATSTNSEQGPVTADGASDIPQLISDDAEPADNAKAAPREASSELIRISTDTLEVMINPRGGDFVHAALPQYFHEVDTPDQPFVLMDNSGGLTYLAQSGLVGANGTDTRSGRPLFAATKTQYQLAEDQDSLTVDLTHQQGDVLITKRFIFHRGQYRVDVEYLIDNQSDAPWQANFYAQIKRD